MNTSVFCGQPPLEHRSSSQHFVTQRVEPWFHPVSLGGGGAFGAQKNDEKWPQAAEVGKERWLRAPHFDNKNHQKPIDNRL